MYLLINSQKEAKEILCLFSDQVKVDLIEYNANIGFNEQLLTALDQLLNKNNLQLSDIKILIVNKYNNTFSSLRSAVATANVIGRTNNIPVIAISQAEVNSLAEENIKLIKSKLGQNFEVLYPQYDREPNITQDKKTS